MSKPIVATTSLCGCFGCHMSLLDIDERILKLIELVEFNKSRFLSMEMVLTMITKLIREGGKR